MVSVISNSSEPTEQKFCDLVEFRAAELGPREMRDRPVRSLAVIEGFQLRVSVAPSDDLKRDTNLKEEVKAALEEKEQLENQAVLLLFSDGFPSNATANANITATMKCFISS